MLIELKKPVELRFEVVETDDHIPSMRVNVMIKVEQYLHTVQYDGCFWIDCSIWDGFAQSLELGALNGALLSDMNDCFKLKIRCDDDERLFSCSLDKADVNNERLMSFAVTSKLDDDTFASVRKAFLDFPVWW
jgi:hypothetical protein